MSQQRLFVMLACLTSCAQAQWLNYIPSGTPRLADGKPNLAAPAPRGLDGHPDLSGVWMHETTTVEEVKRLFGHRYDDDIAASIPGMEIGTQHKYWFDILVDFQPNEDAMIRPEAAAIRRQRMAQRDPTRLCTGLPSGFTNSNWVSEPIKIIQSPQVTVILYEAGNLHRQIFTDGRTLPKEFELPAFNGYTTGHWEKDTLVAETAGFNDRTALDRDGHFHSDALRVTERFHRRDFGNLDIEMTFDDPKTYTRPFTINVPHHLVADNDIFEMYCENEKDQVHMRKD